MSAKSGSLNIVCKQLGPQKLLYREEGSEDEASPGLVSTRSLLGEEGSEDEASPGLVSTRPLLGEEVSGDEASPGLVSTRPLLGEEGSEDEASPGLAPLLAVSCYWPLPFTLVRIKKKIN